MKEKLFAMRCLNTECMKILMYMGDMGDGSLGVNDVEGDFDGRFHTDDEGSYIECKYCGKKNAFLDTKDGDLPIIKLSHIRDE